MKIAFNPSTVGALIAPPNNKDITFDLRGHNIFARGVKFCGTDTNTWRDIKINNVSIDSNILDLRDGDNTTLTNINGVVAINSTWRPVVDNLTSDSTTSSLSANQGRVLKALIDDKSDSGHTHDDRYLKLTGGWMSGDINFGGDNKICWGRNTDSASISFKNDGDGDTDSYMSFVTSDNGNEYFRWSHSSGSTNTEWMALRSDGLRVGGTKVSLEGHSHNDLYYTKTEVNNKLNGKSDTSHTHDDRYLKLTGGTMSGTIYRNSGGTTISGRDNAIIRQTYAPGGSSWNPIACVDTETGTWTLGHLSSGSNNTDFNFCFSTNADYNAGNNNGNYVTLRNKVGTIALLSDIPSSLKNPYALTISLNGTSQGPYDGSAAKNINITPSSIGAATSDHNHDGRYVRYYAVTTLDCNNLAVGLTAAGVSATNAAHTNHSAFLYISDVGTPFQIQIPDSSVPYIYKRYYSSGEWSGWFKLNAGYADSAGSASNLTVHQYLSNTDTTWWPLIWGGSSHNNTSDSTGEVYKSHDVLSWQTSSQTLYATNIQTENIKHLSIGGGIYWNPYVESASDGSDSASITLVKSGVAGGTTLVLSQMNDSNDTIQFQTNGSARLYHNSYPILTTQNTYVSNNKGYINGTEITQVNNADTVDGYHAGAFVKIKQFRFSQYNQGTWTKILTITINSTADLQPVIAFSWIPSECSRTIWADFSINWRSNSPIFYAIWKGMNSRTLKVVNSSGAIWDVWVSGNKTDWDPFGEIQVTYTHNITSYNGGNLGYSDVDPGGTICITGGQVNYANSAGSATKLQTPRKIWGQSFDGTGNVDGPIRVHYKSGDWNNYNEGIRLYGNSKDNSWSNIHFGCDPATTSGSHSNQWFIGRNTSNQFGIFHGTDAATGIINITTNNNVGIGTNAPAYKLDVNGQVRASGFRHSSVNSDNYMLLAGGGYKSFGGDNSHPIFLGYLDLNHGNNGTISSSFYCLGYSVPFTYTRGGNYCRISIPDTSYQVFYIRAAIASVNYSGGGMDTWTGYRRGAGAWWLHCYVSGLNEVRVKGFRQANDNNDSWWGGNPLVSDNSGANRITVCIFGNVTFR